MRIGLTWLASFLVALTPAGVALALDARLDVGGFREEDREIAEEIAGFDAEDRHAALVAAGHPEDLLAIAEIQRDSADDFAALLDAMPREDQEQVWDLVRYPGLVADLARGGAKSDAELDRIAQRHPEEIRDAIRREGRTRYSTWVEIYALDLEAEQAFASVIGRHPADVRAAFQRLRSRPELLSVLTGNVGVATRIGAAYREDPTRVEARFDDLHQDVVARRQAQEREWAKELEDPAAREEIRSAARDFAEDNGYDLDEEVHATGSAATRTVYVHHYTDVYPYPYWFGYPTWYAYPYWYPASVWTHLGFRIGGGDVFVGIGLPSPYFLGWYSGYYYGYPGYWGPRYSRWGYAPYYGSWAWSGRPRHFRSAHFYEKHRPTTFHGHRRPRRIDSSPHDGYASSRRAAQERLMQDGRRQWSTRRGDDPADRFGGSDRFDRDGQDGGDGRGGRGSRSDRFDRPERRERPEGFDGSDRGDGFERDGRPERRRGGYGVGGTDGSRGGMRDGSPERPRNRTWRTGGDPGAGPSTGPRTGAEDAARQRLIRRGGERDEQGQRRFGPSREDVRPAPRRSELRSVGGPPPVSSGPRTPGDPRWSTSRREAVVREGGRDLGRPPARAELTRRSPGAERAGAQSRLQRGGADGSGRPSRMAVAPREGRQASRLGISPGDGGRASRVAPSAGGGERGRSIDGPARGGRSATAVHSGQSRSGGGRGHGAVLGGGRSGGAPGGGRGGGSFGGGGRGPR